jgi:hypothetical protein
MMGLVTPLDVLRSSDLADIAGRVCFGDGADGDLTVNTGQTVVLTAEADYQNVTVDAGGTLQLGTHYTNAWPCLRVAGRLTIRGSLICGLTKEPAAAVGRPGGARKTTAGAGSAPSITTEPMLWGGRCGSSGRGGGDGTNAGGGGATSITSSGFADALYISRSATVIAGSTGAGSNGIAGGAFPAVVSPEAVLPLPGAFGPGGGGGALKVAGGSNYGGAGGAGGYGGGILVVYANEIVVESGVIHADGGDGENGEDGEASNSIGDISGGGGGGAGGGGGYLMLCYASLSNSGTIRAAGGLGGTGGAGREYTAGGPNQARATSNGGNGGAGGTGIILMRRIV